MPVFGCLDLQACDPSGAVIGTLKAKRIATGPSPSTQNVDGFGNVPQVLLAASEGTGELKTFKHNAYILCIVRNHTLSYKSSNVLVQ
jgi:hypothetical protein